jgi:hypothetical protein
LHRSKNYGKPCSVIPGADVAALELSYEAPAECPSADALRDAVGKLVTEQRNQPYAARVSITLAGGRYLARITTSDGSERSLSGTTCAEVVEATSVVLALAINPKQAEPAPAAEPPANEPKPAPPAEPRPPAPAQRSTPHTTRLRPRPDLFAGAALVGDLGTLPHAGLGVAARAGLELGPWSASVQPSYLFVQHERLASDPNKGGNFSLWSVAAIGCGAPYHRDARVDFCAGAELGRIAGDGVGSSGADKNTGGLWVALLAGPELAVTLVPPLRLRLAFDAAVPVVGRHPFMLDGNQVHQPNSVSLRSTLGFEVVF